MVLDTSVLIRYLTNDNPVKAKKFANFIKSGQRFIITDVTFAETYWILIKLYNHPKDQIITSFKSLLSVALLKSREGAPLTTLGIHSRGYRFCRYGSPSLCKFLI